MAKTCFSFLHVLKLVVIVVVIIFVAAMKLWVESRPVPHVPEFPFLSCVKYDDDDDDNGNGDDGNSNDDIGSDSVVVFVDDGDDDIDDIVLINYLFYSRYT